MVEWLSTKLYERLTEAEVKAELENFLRNCKDEGEFKKECRRRFGGPMITATWTHNVRIATIAIQGREGNIHASVRVS